MINAQSDTPGEGLPDRLNRIAYCYGATLAEDDLQALADAIDALASPSVIGSDTAGLRSDYSGLVERAREELAAIKEFGEDENWASAVAMLSELTEAIAALSRAPDVYPGVADAIERLHEAAHRDEAITISVRAQDLRNVLAALATPPAPQPDTPPEGWQSVSTPYATQAPQPVGTAIVWHPISEADRSIATVQTFGDITLRNSDTFWVRDEDGRVYEAVWTDHKQGYWWDIEGESPVDPAEYAPHPLATTPAPQPIGSDTCLLDGRAWRTMETAPKDGTRILAWPCHLDGDHTVAAEAYWYVHSSVQGWITDLIDCGEYDFEPTHWMPLPARPKAGESEVE